MLNSVGVGLVRNSQANSGHIQDDISRADFSTGIYEMIIKVVGIERGITLFVPSPDRHRVVDHITHIRIPEVKLILITGATGRTGNQLAIQPHLDVAGV